MIEDLVRAAEAARKRAGFSLRLHLIVRDDGTFAVATSREQEAFTCAATLAESLQHFIQYADSAVEMANPIVKKKEARRG